MIQRIKFKGQNFIFIQNPLGGGAIATEEAYSSGDNGYAIITILGQIIRYGKIIGHVSEIEFGESVSIEIKPEAMLKIYDRSSDLITLFALLIKNQPSMN